MPDIFRDYLNLTKPGIVRANAMTAAAGFFLASHGHINPPVLAAAVLGLALVIAAACVVNNYLDRGIDAHMARTKNRALVTGRIQPTHALIYAAVLAMLGFGLLAGFTNLSATLTAAVGCILYLIVYGVAKRHTTYSTVIGSLSGAVPPVVGYVAASNHFDTGALLVFLALVCWQMPHFYAIAIFRAPEYAAAKLPVLTVKRGTTVALQQIIVYIVAFTIVTLLFTPLHYAGYVYFAIMLILNAAWLALAIQGLRSPDPVRWARRAFGVSLLVLLGFSLAISTTAYLP